MLKTAFAAAFLLLFAASSFAAGPAQIWRLEITSAAEGIVEVSEIELRETAGGANVTDLIRLQSYNEAVPILTWSIDHNLDLQPDRTTVDTAAVNATSDPVEPTSVTIVDKDNVEIVFPEAVTGDATVRGISFDTPATNRPGNALPPIEGITNRPSAAAFDNNKASWFKSNRAPTERSPLALQYTYWIGDPSRYPNVVEYTITARSADTSPTSWRLLFWKDGGWQLADQQAGINFEDGETKVFAID